jgi:hypothetical protein
MFCNGSSFIFILIAWMYVHTTFSLCIMGAEIGLLEFLMLVSWFVFVSVFVFVWFRLWSCLFFNLPLGWCVSTQKKRRILLNYNYYTCIWWWKLNYFSSYFRSPTFLTFIKISIALILYLYISLSLYLDNNFDFHQCNYYYLSNIKCICFLFCFCVLFPFLDSCSVRNRHLGCYVST